MHIAIIRDILSGRMRWNGILVSSHKSKQKSVYKYKGGEIRVKFLSLLYCLQKKKLKIVPFFFNEVYCVEIGTKYRT
jgi:hypothetical protein